MAKVFNIFIYIALIIHFLFGMWIYGNSKLLINTDTFLKIISDNIKNLVTVTNDDNYYTNEIITRITLSHNLICLIFLALLIIIVILRYTVFSFFELICKKSKRREMVERKNMEIGIAIPMTSLYKNYELRKLQMMKMMKVAQGSKKSTSTTNGVKTNLRSITNLKNYFQIGINYDREFLEYKLEKITNQNYKNLDFNFDNEIKSHVKKFELEENEIIYGDVSYNISVI